MKALLQRVKYAGVTVDNKQVSRINQGLLIFLGVEKNDTAAQADFLAKKAANLRIFEDENQKMNLSVQDIKGEVLVVSQFTLRATLHAEIVRGLKPQPLRKTPMLYMNIFPTDCVTFIIFRCKTEFFRPICRLNS